MDVYKVYSFISQNINMIIFVCGVVLACFIISNAFKLSNHKSKIEDAIERKRAKTFINKKTRELYDNEESEIVNPETIRKYEKEFNKTRSLYNMYTQLIPIFPLLGILGTVAGLMSQVVAENIDALNGSLNIALGSTFLGLISAIILKVIIIIFSGKIVDDVEIMLDDYYNKFNDAMAQKNIFEE